MNVLRENPQLVPIVNGVILTGWQRFDHFAILCELLPVAIPSLALNLLTMKEGKYKNALREKVSKMLQCEPTTSLGDEFTAVSEFAQCDYPGSSISVRVEKLAELKLNITKMYQHSSVKGWLTPYNLKALYGHSFFAEKWYNKTVEIREELEAVGVILRQELAEVYHEDTVNEWLYTNIQTDLNRLKELQESVAAIMQKSEFPVRPLSRLRDLEL